MSGRPKMCPSCGKLMGTADVCPYCGADARSVSSRFKVMSRGMSGGNNGTPASFVLLLVMVGIYLASIAFGGVEDSGGIFGLLAPKSELQHDLGAMSSRFVAEGEWWRLFTAIFLHAGLVHLLMNGFFMWALGRPYEEEVGSAPFLTLFLAAGVIGFVFSYVFSGGTSLGASGGGFGLVGAIIGRRRLLDGDFRDPRTLRAIELAVINLVIGFLVVRVDNFAHIGGLVTGLVLGYVQARVDSARVWLVAGGVLTAATLTAGALAFVHRGDRESLMNNLQCAAMAESAVTHDEVLLDKADDALACFDKAPEPPRDNGLIDMRDGLRSAVEARRSGGIRAEADGVARVHGGIVKLSRWLKAFNE